MSESNPHRDDEIRFGRTLITVAVGDLVNQPVEAIVAAGNQRAMFAAGPTGTLWSAAGEEVERELRTHAPLDIGSAVATGSGRLAERGILHIFHVIIAAGLGEPPKRLEIPRALEAALDLATKLRVRSIALPILGAAIDAPTEERADAATVVIESLVAHLRTRSHRIDHGILVTRFEDDRAPLLNLIIRARERLWTGLE
jgi:O-acetyl-ADP-ribose deacetylase (regulator of RNase III)